MPLPDSSSFLKVLCARLIITQLPLQISLMQELFDKVDEHVCVSIKEILNFVRRHKLWVVRRFESAFDEVVGARYGGQLFELREVISVELKIFDQYLSNFDVFRFIESPNDLLFQAFDILSEHLDLLHLVQLDKLEAELQDIKVRV